MFVRFQKIQHQQPISRGSFAHTLWGICKLVFVIAIIAIGGWFFLQHKIQTDLKSHVQAKISEGLASTGLIAELGQARFHEGKGIQLNDLHLRASDQAGNLNSSSSQHSSIEIYEAFLHAPATVTELATGELDIQAIELRRARLTIVRSADGTWDLAEAIQKLMANPRKDEQIPVALRDCEVQFVDQAYPQRPPIKLTGLNVFIQPRQHKGRSLIQVNGGFQSAAISQIEFTTFIDPDSETWNTKISATQARLSSELIALLPDTLQSEFKDLTRLNGFINFTAKATGRNSLDQLPNFQVAGDVKKLSVDDQRLPFPVENVNADFVVTQDGLSVSNGSGATGKGRFTNCNYSQNGLVSRTQWHLDGSVKQFNFDDTERLRRWLPQTCQKFCEEYSPSGTSDMTFDMTHNGRELKRDIKAKLTDMAFTYFKMPYLVENCVGPVEILDDQCRFNVRSVKDRYQCGINGFVKGLGKSPTYEVNISVPGDVPIDQKLLDAIDGQPKLAKVIRAFSPTGRVGGIGKITKRIPNGITNKDFDVRLKECLIRHDSFDYPIRNVNGLVQSRNDQFTFSNLTGNNGSGKVICNGVWNPRTGLFARFLCESISLNDQLRYALKPEIREIWNGFRPRGTIDFIRVDMTLPIGEPEVDLVVEARMEKPKKDAAQTNYVSIHPIWFPYEINHINGTVNIGKGEIKLTNFKGIHQNTELVCQGDGRYSDDAWSVKLKDLLVLALKVDEDLLAAVPKSLAPPLRKLKFEGLLNVKGEFTVASSKMLQRATPQAVQLASYQTSARPSSATNQPIPTNEPEQGTNLAWNLRLDMNQAKMLIGFPIENVFGMVKLIGEYDGYNAICRGDLDIDSLTTYDLQFTKIRGPIWIDNDRSAAGVFAQPKAMSTAQENISPVANSQKPQSLTGTLHKGTVHFDAQMDSSTKGEFYVQATLGDGCLKTACREFAPTLENVEGHSFAAIRMTGDQTGTHTLKGDGKIQLRDAKIYELPVFLSMLKILKVKQADRTAFDSSNIDFTVHGETFDFNRMEFIGDAISLIGNGKMNLDRDINLNFYSVMGRNRLNIPLLSELYKASSQKVLWINVDGKLDNPQTHRHVLPQLNESLQQLFQPNVNRQTQQRGPGGLVGRASRQTQNYPMQINSQWPAGSQSLRSSNAQNPSSQNGNQPNNAWNFGSQNASPQQQPTRDAYQPSSVSNPYRQGNTATQTNSTYSSQPTFR